jgi:predicted  nucleic acid-binding Zn-ribbon protein
MTIGRIGSFSFMNLARMNTTESESLEERVEKLESEMPELRELMEKFVDKENKRREKHLKQFDFSEDEMITSEDEIREAKNE